MADRTISSKKVVRTAPVEVSPLATLPSTLDEGQYRVADGDATPDFATTELFMPPPGEAGGHTLDIPGNVRIKSQTIRFLPGGGSVVDIVVEFDEVKGATDYEYRIIAQA